MSTNFKVGDKVKIYSSDCPKFNIQGEKGIVSQVGGDIWPEFITVDVPEKGKHIVHPKQCRKLKPKKPKLTVDILTCDLQDAFTYGYDTIKATVYIGGTALRGNFTRFVEKDKKEG